MSVSYTHLDVYKRQQVIRLQRVRVMNIELGKLKSGEWRHLTETELAILFKELES